MLASSLFLYKNIFFYQAELVLIYIYGALLVNFQPDVLNPRVLIAGVFCITGKHLWQIARCSEIFRKALLNT